MRMEARKVAAAGVAAVLPHLAGAQVGVGHVVARVLAQRLDEVHARSLVLALMRGPPDGTHMVK